MSCGLIFILDLILLLSVSYGPIVSGLSFWLCKKNNITLYLYYKKYIHYLTTQILTVRNIFVTLHSILEVLPLQEAIVVSLAIIRTWQINQVHFRNLFLKGGCFKTFLRSVLWGNSQWSWRVGHVAAGGTRQWR